MRNRPAFRKLLRALLLAVPATVSMMALSHGAAMERGVAITDPRVLRVLDETGLGLARMLGAEANSTGAELFALPSMASLQAATDRDFNLYVIRHKDDAEKRHLFDRDALNAQGTRFDLAGIVNRMDRAYVSPDECGEIRLIYRPIANSDSTNKDTPPSRLPMTFNLVMKAKPARATDVTCAELAKRWLATSDAAGTERAPMLTAKGGALEWVTREAIDRIELNIQVARASADANDFEGRADYLMKVFRYDGTRFAESPLENQIDAERLRSDATLTADFRQWLFDPAQLADLDRGTIVVPDRFLASSTITVTPAHDDPDSQARALFNDDDIVAALAKASAHAPLQNLRSPAGFARRLDDITCSGCHQTRAVGGFHFPGLERPGWEAGAVVAAGSPHFFGDQERRRDILTAFRDGRTPDLSRGFSARPQDRRSHELTGTTYVNGWGAMCYGTSATAAPDKSFTSWTCAEGLTCQTPDIGAKVARTGFCFPKSN